MSPRNRPPPPPLPPPPAAHRCQQGAGSAPAAQPSPSGALRSWRLRTQSGVVQLDGLETLQRWVSEGRITRDAEISRTGEAWRRLGDISELEPIFRVAEASRPRRLSAPGAITTGRQSPLLAEPSGPRALGAVPALRDEPAFARHSAVRTLPSAVGEQAAWEHQTPQVPGLGGEVKHHPRAPRRRYLGRIVVLVGAALLLITVGITVALQSERLRGTWQRIFGGKDVVADARALLRQRLAQDDEASLSALDQEFAADPRPTARVWRAEVLAIWAQHLRDQAELLERQARQRITAISRSVNASAANPAEPAPAAASPAPLPAAAAPRQDETRQDETRQDEATARREARALRLQAAGLRDTAARQLAVAEVQLRSAVATTPPLVDLPRAQADLHRMLGRPDLPALLQRARTALPDDPELAYVEGLYWQEHNDIARAVSLLETALARSRAAGGQPLLRAAVALAMIDLRSGWFADAKRYAELVRALNPRHAWAGALLEQIAAEASPSRRGGGAESLASAEAPGGAPDGGPASGVGGTAAATPSPLAEGNAPAGDSNTRATPPGASTGTAAPTPSDATGARASGGSYESLLRAGDRASEHGRTMQALSAYERALRVRPDGVEAITGLGYCALDLQQLGLAIQRFTQALGLRPSYGDAMVGLAETYQAMGDKPRALDSYRAYLRVHPDGAKARLAQQNAKELGEDLSPTAPGSAPPNPSSTDPAPAPTTPPAESDHRDPPKRPPAAPPIARRARPRRVAPPGCALRCEEA
ncbi:MAG: tetratricopeptide repeat protein [Proteobacteria bacterium]|nr:tetratricopeptide repeat protein [Pseudomonadota bacterium]